MSTTIDQLVTLSVEVEEILCQISGIFKISENNNQLKLFSEFMLKELGNVSDQLNWITHELKSQSTSNFTHNKPIC